MRIAVLLIAALVVAGCTDPSAHRLGTNDEEPFSPNHGPIRINGDDDFTGANGVRSGRGTSDDPFVVPGLLIQPGQGQTGIHIVNTKKHVVIQDCKVMIHGGAKAIHIQKSANVKVLRCVILTPSPGPPTAATSSAPSSSVSGSPTQTTSPATTSSPTATAAPDSWAVLVIEDTTNVTIAENRITDGGILLDGTQGTQVTGNTIVHGETASSANESLIDVRNGADHVLSNNTLQSPIHGGINATNATNLTIDDNEVHVGGPGISIGGATGANVTSNNVNGADHDASPGIRIEDSQNLTVDNNHVTNTTGPGIEASNVTNVALDNNTVESSGDDGIRIDGSVDVHINEANVSGSGGAGIRLDDVQNATITGSNIQENQGDGVQANNATTVTISDNTVSGNEGYGIALSGDESSIHNNNVTANGGGGSGGGILLEGNQNEIFLNEVTDNQGWGLVVMPGSTQNQATGNTVTGSDTGGQVIVPDDGSNTIDQDQGEIVTAPPEFDPRPKPDDSSNWTWLFILGGLILVGMGGVWIVGRRRLQQ